MRRVLAAAVCLGVMAAGGRPLAEDAAATMPQARVTPAELLRLTRTFAGAATPGPAAVPASSTLMAPVPVSGTLLAPTPVAGTVFLQPVPATAGAVVPPASPAASSTVSVGARPRPAPRAAPVSRTASGTTVTVPFEDLHKRAQLVMMPTGYAAHMKGRTGENAEVFLAWYIGTLWNESGLSIARLFSLYIGADGKWSFLEEKGVRPAAAIGYYGGLLVPYTGGTVRASALAQQQKDATKQAFVHDFYLALSKSFGPVSFTGGAMYGVKKAFPRAFPMLRDPATITVGNPPPESLWTGFGGMDIAFRQQHFKVEVITPPFDEVYKPVLVQTHIDAFMGFDVAYLHDRFGWEIIGYYILPFLRWPDKNALIKEVEKAARADKERERRRRQQGAGQQQGDVR